MNLGCCGWQSAISAANNGHGNQHKLYHTTEYTLSSLTILHGHQLHLIRPSFIRILKCTRQILDEEKLNVATFQGHALRFSCGILNERRAEFKMTSSCRTE